MKQWFVPIELHVLVYVNLPDNFPETGDALEDSIFDIASNAVDLVSLDHRVELELDYILLGDGAISIISDDVPE